MWHKGNAMQLKSVVIVNVYIVVSVF